MRRPPSVCRRAVESLQSPPSPYIWISDDLLSNTFHRFFPAACLQQKRRGSHVPGPLEARRRATKRRMTVSAGFYPQENFPPLFNLRALFGRKDAPPAWRYEPPSLPQNTDTAPFDVPPSPHLSRRPSTHSEPTAATNTAHSLYSFSQNVAGLSETRQEAAIENITESVLSRTVDVVASLSALAVDSQTCFENFKMRVAHATDLSETHRRGFVAKAFQSARPSDVDAWTFNVMVVERLARLRWDPTPIFANSNLARFSIPPMYTRQNLEFMRCLESSSARFPQRVHKFFFLNVKIATAASQADRSTSSEQDAELLSIVGRLWESAHLSEGTSDCSIRDLLRAVTKKIRDQAVAHKLLAVIAASDMKHEITHLIIRASDVEGGYSAAMHVLSCIPRSQILKWLPSITFYFAKAVGNRARAGNNICTKRLATWLKALHYLDTQSALGHPGVCLRDLALSKLVKRVFAERQLPSVEPQTLLVALASILSQQDVFYADQYEKVLSVIDSATILLQQEPSVSPEEFIVAIISKIRREALLYQELADDAITLTAQHADFGHLLRLATNFDQQKIIIPGNSALTNVVQEKVTALERQKPAQTESERQQRALAMGTCELILQVLDKITSTTNGELWATEKQKFRRLQANRQFEHILSRAQADHGLPLAYRYLTADISVERRVVLIHQLAHQYSLDKTRTQRECWRAIYYLYKYLQENSLDIGPLFSRAVVRISIMRPLEENRFVSVRRLIWVCHLVTKIEGSDAAKIVEAHVWRWRGDLIKHAKDVWVHVGGDVRSKAHINTMKRLDLI